MGLVLKRAVFEEIVIRHPADPAQPIRIRVAQIGGSGRNQWVRLWIEADPHVRIDRLEIDAIREGKPND